jgi:hypothetical protein
MQLYTPVTFVLRKKMPVPGYGAQPALKPVRAWWQQKITVPAPCVTLGKDVAGSN